MFEECRVEGEVTLSSGRKSSVFYDFDLLKPTEAASYIEQLVQQVPKALFEKADFIACPALGGIVPGWLVAFAKQKPFVIVDKEGHRRGPEFRSGNYLIVDDVVTSFQTVERVKVALFGMRCVGVLSYIFRGTREDLDNAGSLSFYYLARKEPEK